MPASPCVDARQPLLHVRLSLLHVRLSLLHVRLSLLHACQPLLHARQPLLHARQPLLPARRPLLPARQPLFPVRRPQLPARQLPARPPRFSPLLSLLLVFCGCRLCRLRPAALSSLSLCRFSRSPPRLRQLFRLSSNTLSARVCFCDRPLPIFCRLFLPLAGHVFGRRRGRGRVARVWLRQP